MKAVKTLSMRRGGEDKPRPVVSKYLPVMNLIWNILTIAQHGTLQPVHNGVVMAEFRHERLRHHRSQ